MRSASVTIRLHGAEHAALVVHARENGTSMAAVVRKALASVLCDDPRLPFDEQAPPVPEPGVPLPFDA